MTTHLQSPIHLQLPLSGMSCANCAGRITTALNKLEGVEATVNFALEQAAIDLASPDRLPAVLESIKAQGYDYGSETILFQITGMTCAGCSARLNKMLAALPGVISADVNFSIEQARIVLVPGMQTPAALREQIEALGFGAQLAQGSASGRRQQLLEREAQEAASARQAQTRVITSALLTLPLLAGMLAMAGLLPWHLPAWLELVLATPVQFWIGARFYRGAWLAIKNRSANMDVLVATGTSAAYFYSLYLLLNLGMAASGQLYFEASAIIITLISLGKLLEARARRSTQSAIRELMALRPETATVWRGESWQSVAIDEVLRGDRLRVLVGERVPVDGRIVSGTSELDESILTGESLPVPRGEDDKVLGGAINRSGVLEIEATTVGEDSSLSKIIALVENAQMGKAPLQQLVDKVSAVFVPFVMAIALFTLLVWYAISNDFGQALLAAVAVLVIACPCALGLATPAAIGHCHRHRGGGAPRHSDQGCRYPAEGPRHQGDHLRQDRHPDPGPAGAGQLERQRRATAPRRRPAAGERTPAGAGHARGSRQRGGTAPAGSRRGAGRGRYCRSGRWPHGRHRQYLFAGPARHRRTATG